MLATFDRALVKSDEQARVGNLPRLVRSFTTDEGERQVWSAASRTTGGAVYLLDTLTTPAGTVEAMCDCQALGHCWHITHTERAIAGEIGHFTVPTAPARPRYSNADIFGVAAD